MIPQTTYFMHFAKCKNANLDINFFFPEKPQSARAAIQFCQTCVVKKQCGDYAIKNNIKYGIFGGLSVRSRTKKKDK